MDARTVGGGSQNRTFIHTSVGGSYAPLLAIRLNHMLARKLPLVQLNQLGAVRGE